MADVLIVDDDALGSDTVSKLLRAKGHEVRHALDVGAAFRCLSERQPNLILLDLGLPRVFGLTVLEALRDEPRFADIPVAVYTGGDEPDVRAAARRLGAVEFIVKGQPWADTYAQIEHSLGSREVPS